MRIYTLKTQNEIIGVTTNGNTIIIQLLDEIIHTKKYVSVTHNKNEIYKLANKNIFVNKEEDMYKEFENWVSIMNPLAKMRDIIVVNSVADYIPKDFKQYVQHRLVTETEDEIIDLIDSKGLNCELLLKYNSPNNNIVKLQYLRLLDMEGLL